MKYTYQENMAWAREWLRTADEKYGTSDDVAVANVPSLLNMEPDALEAWTNDICPLAQKDKIAWRAVTFLASHMLAAGRPLPRILRKHASLVLSDQVTHRKSMPMPKHKGKDGRDLYRRQRAAALAIALVDERGMRATAGRPKADSACDISAELLHVGYKTVEADYPMFREQLENLRAAGVLPEHPKE